MVIRVEDVFEYAQHIEVYFYSLLFIILFMYLCYYYLYLVQRN